MQPSMAAKYGIDDGKGVEWLESQPENNQQGYVNLITDFCSI